MNSPFEGKIISANLGEFSKRQIVYGYIGIELPDKSHIKIKIDSYTWYESLVIGDEVVVEANTLANTDILVARKIRLKSSLEMENEGKRKAKATA
ncbi:MAG: hypothetical protein ACW99G_24475 [Candidatus Thorarchaeota archaeon]|jgi:hypothetical protein